MILSGSRRVFVANPRISIVWQLALLNCAAMPAFSLPIRSNVVCIERKWQDILTFFIITYGAHAVTTVPIAGAKFPRLATQIVAALLVPTGALFVAISRLVTYFSRKIYDIYDALSSHALLVVVKSDNALKRSVAYIQ
jgi:hypothetical protein